MLHQAVQFGEKINPGTDTDRVAVKFFVGANARRDYSTELGFYDNSDLASALPELFHASDGADENAEVLQLGQRALALPPLLVITRGQVGTECLRAWIERQPRPRTRTREMALFMMFEGVLTCLARVHAAGVVHSDIKPDNCLVAGPPEHWFLIDFGHAGHAGAAPQTRGMTVPFAAPELVQARAATRAPPPFDAKQDIWSLGVTMWHAYTERDLGLYAARDAHFWSRCAASELQYPWEQAPLGERLRRSNENMHNAIMACLKRNPANRPTSAGLAACLNPFTSVVEAT